MIDTALGRGGKAYVVWNEIDSGNTGRVWLAGTHDGGRSWSAPHLVGASTGAQAFLPSVAVPRDGTLGVSFDDFRGDRRDDSRLTTRVWLRHSRDGARTWRELRIGGPFDLLTGPRTTSTGLSGRFLGDYQGLVGLPHGFAALFAKARPKARFGPSDVFFVRVAVPPRIRLTVRPRRVRAGRLVLFRFRASVRRGGRLRPLRGATVSFAGRHLRTGSRGSASVSVRFRSPGVRRARATKRGYRPGRARARVLAAPCAAGAHAAC